MRNLIFGSSVWVIRIGLNHINYPNIHDAFLRYVFCNVVYYRPWQSRVFQNSVKFIWYLFNWIILILGNNVSSLHHVYLQIVRSTGCLYVTFWIHFVSSHKPMMTQVEWKITKDGLFSLSCLAGNTPALAVVIRLICSPGLTLFSLCLLVVHKHFITFEVTEAATYIKLRHPKTFNTFLHIFSLCYQRCFISY